MHLYMQETATIDLVWFIDTLQSKNWVALVAVITWALIALAKRYATADKFPPQWRWLRPILMAATIGFAQGLIDGGTFMSGLLAMLDAAGLGGIGAMVIHGTLKSSPLPYGNKKETKE